MDTVPGVYPGISPVISGTQKTKKILSMSRFLLGHDVQTHNNSLNNLRRGVGERVLFRDDKLTLPIRPINNTIFTDRLASYRDALLKDLGFQSAVARELFPSFYTGPRKALYQKAVDSLSIKAVSPRDAMLKTFVKAEKLNFSIKNDPVPRVIQPRDPRYNVEVGRFLRPVEHKVYRAIDNLFKAPTIMSAYNAFTTARILKDKWDLFQEPVCIGMDASRFDQHVSAQALKFEHSIYNRIFKSKELSTLLKWQIDNRGIARASDGWFKYNVKGSRMSGDMNTSMGNKIIMCLMSLSYLESLNIPFAFANNGDDCLIFTDRKYLKSLNGLNSYYRDFGFDVVCEEPVYEFEHVEFCQTKPVMSNNVWRMVRKPYTCLTKDVTCVNLGHDIEMYRRLLNSVGECGLATATDIPVMGSFYRMLKRFGIEGSVVHWDEYNYYVRSSREASCKSSKPDDYGRYSFWLMSGISPDEQLSIEEYFDNSIWGGDNRQLINQLLPLK